MSFYNKLNYKIKKGENIMPIFKKEGNQLVEYTQPSQITESLKPQGNIVFANLPNNPETYDMYKVTDDFTTDNRFEEPNKEVKAPIFIYFNGTKWVLFASSGGDTHIIGTRSQCISWARQGMIPDGSVCIFTDDYATSTPYVVGTQAQINAMLSQGLLGDGTVVIITDDYSADVNLAENVGYDNTTSGLSADDVQGAIDEVKSELSVKVGVYTTTVTSNASGLLSIPFESNPETVLMNVIPLNSGDAYVARINYSTQSQVINAILTDYSGTNISNSTVNVAVIYGKYPYNN